MSKKVSQMTAAAAALGSMEVHVNNAGADEKVTLTQIATFMGHTYSTTEQVWGTWIDGNTIYCRTWEVGDGVDEYLPITGLTTASVDIILNTIRVYADDTVDPVWNAQAASLRVTSGTYELFSFGVSFYNFLTVWYTKP